MPDTTTPPEAPAPQLPQSEIDSGKTMAILCYLPVSPVNLIVSIVCLAQKNNAYSLYHAKQSLNLLIWTFVGVLIAAPFCAICIGFPLLIAVAVGALVLSILGIVNASGGECKPLPLIGQFADKWFGKIQKA